jgi:hypothetical protein
MRQALPTLTKKGKPHRQSSAFLAALVLLVGLLNFGIAGRAFAQTNNSNPVLPQGTADPDMHYFGGSYRIYAVSGSSNRQLAVYSSPNLLGFTAGSAPVLDLANVTWAGATATVSGPAVVFANNTYYLYFAADGKIGVATSTSATGPFTDSGTPLVSTDANAPALGTPAVLLDGTTAHLYYGANGVLVERPLAANMTTLGGTTSTVITPTNYVEAPHVLKRDGLYYLFYSSDNRNSNGFNTQYATASAATGPFAFRSRLTYGDDNQGMGSASVFQLPSCDEYYFCYQAFIGRNTSNRAVCLDRMLVEADGSIPEIKGTTYAVAARTPGACSGERIVSGAVYRLTHKGTAMRLDVDNNGTTAGTRVRQQADNGSTAQRWVITRRSDGFFDLQHQGTTQNLQTVGGSQANGALLEQNAQANDNRQRWQLEAMSDGYYKITLKGTTKALEVASNSGAAGADVQLYDNNDSDAQRWKLEVMSMPIQDGQVYKLIHKGTILAMDVDNNSPNRGTQIGQYFDNGNDAQRWILGYDAAKTSYKLTHRNAIDPTSNQPQCLEVPSNRNDPVNVQQYDDNGNDAQRWIIEHTGLDYVKLTHRGTSNPPKCLDVQFGNANLGTRVQQYDDNGSDGQRWIMQLVDYSAAPCNTGFSYNAATYCQSGTNPVLTLTGDAGGTYSVSPATGLTLDAATGAITLATSTPGTYAVTYTASAGCGSMPQTITITAAPVATFSYPTATICAGSTAAVNPTLGTGSTAGTYSSTTGLVIDATTGAINPATSTAGTYTVTNTLAAANGCATATATASVTIEAAPAMPTITPVYNNATTTTLTASTGSSYQWYLGGTAVTGATSQTYVVNSTAQLGSYTVVVTNAAGCASAPSAPLVVTGTARQQANAALRLYPNPTHDGRLQVTLASAPTAELTVLNALGQVVYRSSVAAGAATLELRDLPAGMYLLQTRTKAGEVATARFVRD